MRGMGCADTQLTLLSMDVEVISLANGSLADGQEPSQSTSYRAVVNENGRWTQIAIA